MIDLDLRVAIRHPDLERLVRAVLDADEHDEADWIEWKSILDLATKDGCFPIARGILGLSNRLPADAGRTCEGLGYIVVGATPGKLHGITSVDPADFNQIIEPYLGGAEGPRYTPMQVLIDGEKVLVVTVEPPKAGDPPFMLRRSFNNFQDGTVFVRKHGRTAPATSADQKALHARMLAEPAVDADLEVSLVGNLPISWYEAATADVVIRTWVAGRRNAMDAAARAEDRRRHQPAVTQASGTSGITLANILAQQAELQRTMALGIGATELFGREDKRTLDEYLAQIEDWATRAIEEAPAALPPRYVDAGHGLVAVQVHNPTGRYLPNVHVDVDFEGEHVTTWEPAFDKGYMPDVPRAYGEREPSPLYAGLGSFPDLSHALPVTPRAPRSWIEKGSVHIHFPVGDLRQEATARADYHHIVLSRCPDDGILHGTWKATIPDVYGVLTGTLDVPVGGEPVDLADLLENKPEPEQRRRARR